MSPSEMRFLIVVGHEQDLLTDEWFVHFESVLGMDLDLGTRLQLSALWMIDSVADAQFI